MTDVEPAPQPNAKTSRTRDGNGRYDRSPRSAERDARAMQLKTRSLNYRQIAAELGVSVSSAHAMVARGLRETLQEPAEDLRRLEVEKLDALERSALEILGDQYFIVSAGRETSLPDTEPKLKALLLLLKVAERRSKLLGLDQPQKLTVDGGVRYVLEGVDPSALK